METAARDGKRGRSIVLRLKRNVLRFDLKESREGIGNVVLVRPHKALCIKNTGGISYHGLLLIYINTAFSFCE